MRTFTLTLAALLLVALQSGCASTRSVGYTDGWVKTSTVSYEFVGPPILAENEGRAYHVSVEGVDSASPATVPAFDSHGMHACAQPRDADLRVQVVHEGVQQGEPGAMKLGDKWYPAFEVNVPYQVTIRGTSGDALASRKGEYSNFLTFRQTQGFENRDDAVAAIETIRRLATDGIEENAHVGALAESMQTANELAKGLYEERNVAMDVPVVRSAAGLDLELGYEMLAGAKNPSDVQSALEAYERMGTQQVKEDGTPNNTANYGVACGIAACKLMQRDLRGAWKASEQAAAFEPRGEEVNEIRRIIYEQERITGVRVIPDEDRAEIDSMMATANKLEKFLGAFSD